MARAIGTTPEGQPFKRGLELLLRRNQIVKVEAGVYELVPPGQG